MGRSAERSFFMEEGEGVDRGERWAAFFIRWETRFGVPRASRQQKCPPHFCGKNLRRDGFVVMACHTCITNQTATKVNVADLKLGVAAGGWEPNIPVFISIHMYLSGLEWN